MNYHHTRNTPAITNVSRRGVLKGLAAGGFVLAVNMPARAAPPFYPTGAEGMPNKTVSDPKVFVNVRPDGRIDIVAARAEMGTGAARTTLPMIVADELEADWSKVVVQQSEGDEVKYGNQAFDPADAADRCVRSHDA
jgi:isoquinoline 1-oxidoreductase beta subunit